MPLKISAGDLVDDSTKNLVDEPNIYQTRWPKVLGVLQIVLGMAALGVNIPLHDTNVGIEWAGLWCGLVFIVAGVVQIISARNQVKSWIAISIMASILATFFGIPLTLFSARGVRYEYYSYIKYTPWNTERTAYTRKSMFGVIGLIGVVEMGVAITSALLGCKALRGSCLCMCPLSSKISEILKRLVDKEKNNPLRAVRLGKMQIILGLLAITFNAAGIGVAAKHSLQVCYGFWCGMFFILAGCCLYMSDKARNWILMCLPTLVIAGALTIPILAYGVVGLITPIEDFPYYWPGKYHQEPEMKIIARVCHTGLVIVAVSEFVVAILSLSQVVKCFRWDANFKDLIFQKTDSSKRTVEASMTELTTTVKELKLELTTVREELKQAHSAPGRTDQTVNETPTDKGMLAA